MPRHSPCALYSLTYSRFLVLYSWIMQAINRLLFRKIVIVTHIFLKRCSTIKIHNFLKSLDLKNLLLPCFHHISIHCSVFKVQVPTSLEVRQKYSITNWTLLSDFRKLVEIVGIEPATSCLQGRRSPSWAISPFPIFNLLFRKVWWARVGSNHRPYDYQSYALASWATGPFPTLPQKACAL